MAVFQLEEELSPTDTSEDSIDVRVKPIRLSPPGHRKNKRKSMEPRRYNLENSEFKRRRLNSTGSEERSPQNLSPPRTPSPIKTLVSGKDIRPGGGGGTTTTAVASTAAVSHHHLAPKKRFKFDAMRELQKQLENNCGSSEDRPGHETSKDRPGHETSQDRPGHETGEERPGHETANPFRPWSQPGQSISPPTHTPALIPPMPCIPFLLPRFQTDLPLPLLLPLHQPVQEEPLSLVKEKKPEVAAKKIVKDPTTPLSPEKLQKSPEKPKLPQAEEPVKAEKLVYTPASPDERSKQRNYKNLTRERRVEANARERQRVHTITAAFDTLQAAIPAEEENSKLSKLSVIKIATAYIMALSRMAGHDYTEDQSAPSVQSVIEHCRETISTESKIKKRS